ncbi:MAG TPA: hypothetical protein VLQ65_04075 [Saliniramus sp.]|nr:hypothetical protein [Saliniramus sp.]
MESIPHEEVENPGSLVVVLSAEESDERLFIAEHLHDAGFGILQTSASALR